MPDGANTKHIDHYAQITKSAKFRGYDYGVEKNRQLYKNEEPPEYLFSNIEVPFHIVYGSQDSLFGLTVLYN